MAHGLKSDLLALLKSNFVELNLDWGCNFEVLVYLKKGSMNYIYFKSLKYYWFRVWGGGRGIQAVFVQA